MTRRNALIAAGVLVVALIGYFVVKGNKSSKNTDILADVRFGTFRIEIETTGELEAKNSVKIQGPIALRDFRIFQVSIQKIIDEGTLVNKGDWMRLNRRTNRLNPILAFFAWFSFASL